MHLAQEYFRKPWCRECEHRFELIAKIMGPFVGLPVPVAAPSQGGMLCGMIGMCTGHDRRGPRLFAALTLTSLTSLTGRVRSRRSSWSSQLRTLGPLPLQVAASAKPETSQTLSKRAKLMPRMLEAVDRVMVVRSESGKVSVMSSLGHGCSEPQLMWKLEKWCWKKGRCSLGSEDPPLRQHRTLSPPLPICLSVWKNRSEGFIVQQTYLQESNYLKMLLKNKSSSFSPLLRSVVLALFQAQWLFFSMWPALITAADPTRPFGPAQTTSCVS